MIYGLLSDLWRKWNKWPQPISDEPSYIKQLAPGFVVFGYEGRGYTGGKFAKEEVYRVIRIDEQHLEPPPEGCKENYISDFGRCYPLESGGVRLSLNQREYSKEDLYRLACWIDVIVGDLNREIDQ